MSRRKLTPRDLERIAGRGIRLQGLSYASHRAGASQGAISRLVSGDVPFALGLDARFSYEGLTSRIRKWFKSELQTGDPPFDERMYIETTDSALLGALLKSPPLRTAILELMEGTGGWLQISGQRCSIEAVSLSATTLPPAVALLADLLEALTDAARGAHIAPRSAPPYPDLSTRIANLQLDVSDTRFWPKALFLTSTIIDSFEDILRMDELATGQSRRLEVLRFDGCYLRGDDIARLQSLKSLRELDLGGLDSPSVE